MDNGCARCGPGRACHFTADCDQGGAAASGSGAFGGSAVVCAGPANVCTNVRLIAGSYDPPRREYPADDYYGSNGNSSIDDGISGGGSWGNALPSFIEMTVTLANVPSSALVSSAALALLEAAVAAASSAAAGLLLAAGQIVVRDVQPTATPPGGSIITYRVLSNEDSAAPPASVGALPFCRNEEAAVAAALSAAVTNGSFALALAASIVTAATNGAGESTGGGAIPASVVAAGVDVAFVSTVEVVPALVLYEVGGASPSPAIDGAQQAGTGALALEGATIALAAAAAGAAAALAVVARRSSRRRRREKHQPQEPTALAAGGPAARKRSRTPQRGTPFAFDQAGPSLFPAAAGSSHTAAEPAAFVMRPPPGALSALGLHGESVDAPAGAETAELAIPPPPQVALLAASTLPPLPPPAALHSTAYRVRLMGGYVSRGSTHVVASAAGGGGANGAHYVQDSAAAATGPMASDVQLVVNPIMAVLSMRRGSGQTGRGRFSGFTTAAAGTLPQVVAWPPPAAAQQWS
jgi:hypothetical protein